MGILKLCSRCNERPAVVFINEIKNGVPTSAGYCLRCAKEMNDPRMTAILGNIPSEAIEAMDVPAEDLEELLGEAAENDGDDESNESEESGDELKNGRAPMLNLGKILSGLGLNMPGMNPQQSGQNGSEQAKKPQSDKPNMKKKKLLNQFCTDLTERARKGGIDNVIGRDRELDRVMQILCRRQKNNPCLIGEPGVGKTAVAEALALRIAKNEVPYKLQGKEIQLLDMTAVVAGTQFRGQFEKRMKDLIEEVKTLGNVILVIDEIHTIASAGDAEGSMNAANILKPALSRGEIQVIGATTLNEYRKYIEKDAALERRFQPVIIDEPSVNECIEILKGISEYYESFHGIKTDENVLRKTVILSERYITDRFLPDKAIDLLDEALSSVSLNSDALNRYETARAELKKLGEEKAALECKEDDPAAQEEYFRAAAEIKAKELQLEKTVSDLEEEVNSLRLTEADLARVIEVWTGVPASNIVEGDFDKINRLEATIKSKIIGQDEAADAVVRAVKRSRAGVSPKRKPVSFIFAGPTGVGKTELVKVLSEALFDSPETLIRLDMSEFMEKHSVSRIIGAPPGYVGYDEAGQLTEKIRRKPYSVVLFDEIEKAHPDVMNILLQILDDGRVTDAQGRTVNFENTILVMTTNAGSTFSTPSVGFGKTAHEGDAERTQKALEGFLRPEFLNRVDEIIVFNRLSEENFVGIAKLMLGDLMSSLEEKHITLKWDDSVAELIARNSYSDKMGARNMRRYIEKNVEDKIADIIFADSTVCGIAVSVDNSELIFETI